MSGRSEDEERREDAILERDDAMEQRDLAWSEAEGFKRELDVALRERDAATDEWDRWKGRASKAEADVARLQEVACRVTGMDFKYEGHGAKPGDMVCGVCDRLIPCGCPVDGLRAVLTDATKAEADDKSSREFMDRLVAGDEPPDPKGYEPLDLQLTQDAFSDDPEADGE